MDSKIPTHLRTSKSGKVSIVKEHERKIEKKNPFVDKKDIIEMFNFFHDVIRDIGEGAGESEEWAKVFTESFDEEMKRFDFQKLLKLIRDLKIEGYNKIKFEDIEGLGRFKSKEKVVELLLNKDSRNHKRLLSLYRAFEKGLEIGKEIPPIIMDGNSIWDGNHRVVIAHYLFGINEFAFAPKSQREEVRKEFGLKEFVGTIEDQMISLIGKRVHELTKEEKEKIQGKGKGWWGESKRHSKARKEGKADLFDLIHDFKVSGYRNAKGTWVESYERAGSPAMEEKESRIQKLIEETGFERGRAESEIESQLTKEAEPEVKAKQEAKTQAQIQTKEQRMKVALDDLQSLGMKDNLLINILAPVIKLIIKGMATGEITPEDVARTIIIVRNNKKVKEEKKKEIIAKIRTLKQEISGLKSLHDFMVIHDLTTDQVSATLPGGKPLTGEITSLLSEIATASQAPSLTGPSGKQIKGVIESGDIPLIAIMSSNVKGGGVFKDELIVQFHQTASQGGQRTYRYKLDSPEQAREAFLELVNATSAGKWIWENVRGPKQGPAYFPPHNPTAGGTIASLIPYTVSGRSPVQTARGTKKYNELSKELRKFKMSVKETDPTSPEAFTRPELRKFQRKQTLKELKTLIPRAQSLTEATKLIKQLKVNKP